MSPRRRSPIATLRFSREWLLVAQLFFDFAEALFSTNQALTVGHNAPFSMVLFQVLSLSGSVFVRFWVIKEAS